MNSRSTLKPVYVVAFAGHRSAPLPGRTEQDIEAARVLIAESLKAISEKIAPQNGVIHLITSISDGADAVAIEVAAKLNIKTHILLPLPEELYELDFVGEPLKWEKISRLLASARESDSLCTVRVASASLQRPDCYADTNNQLISSADALIAFWDGKPERGIGGTAQVWKDAESKSIPRVHINPLTKTTHEFDLSKLERGNDAAGKGLFALIDELPPLAASDSDSVNPYIEDCYNVLDAKAKSHGKATRSGLLKAIWLHGSASILAAFGVSYALAQGPDALVILCVVSVVEFLLILYAEFLHRKQHKRHVGEHWIRCRFAAELLRPFQLTRSILDPLCYPIQRQYPQWRRFLVSINFADSVSEIKSLEYSKQTYLSNRIDEQIEHYQTRQQQVSPKSISMYHLIRGLSYSALFVVFCASAYKLSHIDWVGHDAHIDGHLDTSFHAVEFILYLLPIALPLFAGILLALRQSLDLSRRQMRYTQMVNFLVSARKSVEQAHTTFTFKSIVRDTEDALLDELKEFDVAQRIGLQH